jgi:hypothetical protein
MSMSSIADIPLAQREPALPRHGVGDVLHGAGRIHRALAWFGGAGIRMITPVLPLAIILMVRAADARYFHALTAQPAAVEWQHSSAPAHRPPVRPVSLVGPEET